MKKEFLDEETEKQLLRTSRKHLIDNYFIARNQLEKAETIAEIFEAANIYAMRIDILKACSRRFNEF